MHSEYYQVAADVWQRIGRARSAGQRIIAVGTTAMRVLETATATDKLSGWTNIFIYPGYEFKLTSGLLTNFHLPKSTLLMLVAAFLENKGIRNGITEVKKIYQEAIEQQYRFYSFGDAMLVI
jgi:S-adenosylmethionine:tRNA ribosyltransferase-isomerase